MPLLGATDHMDDLRLAHLLADDADSLTTDRFKAIDLHVMSKPDLTPVTDADKAVEEGLRRTLGRVRSRDAITGDGSAPPDPDESMVEGILRQTRYNETAPGVIELYAVLCGDSTTADHPGREFFARRFRSLRQGYADDLRALQAEGRLREGADPDRVAASIIALWDGIQLQWLLERDAVDMVACLTDYLDLMVLPPR